MFKNQLNRNGMSKTLLLALMTAFMVFTAKAQTTFTVDAGMNWVGYMNVFDSTGANYLWGQAWGVNDLKTEIDSTFYSVKLKPNYNVYAAGDPYWSNGAKGNKVMEANTFIEDFNLGGQVVTFEDYVDTFTLDSAYTAEAFIKVLDTSAGYATVLHTTAPITGTGMFNVMDTIPTGTQYLTQVGFTVRGMNANPVEESSLGFVRILGSNTPPPPMIDVTLQVQAAPSSDVFVQGSWDWGIWPGIATTAAAGDLHEVTLELPADSTFEYLFVIIDDAGDTTKEALDPLMSCTNGNSQYTNRVTTLGTADTTICYRWESCEMCYPDGVKEIDANLFTVVMNKDGFTINSADLVQFDQVNIYDLTGRKIVSKSNVSSNQFISAKLQTGHVYLLSVMKDGAMQTWKAVVL